MFQHEARCCIFTHVLRSQLKNCCVFITLKPIFPQTAEVSVSCNCCVFAPEGSPFSWWLGGLGTGRVQTYWGGAQPGSQQCACGLQGDCVDPQHYCNCDADRAEWYQQPSVLAGTLFLWSPGDAVRKKIKLWPKLCNLLPQISNQCQDAQFIETK